MDKKQHRTRVSQKLGSFLACITFGACTKPTQISSAKPGPQAQSQSPGPHLAVLRNKTPAHRAYQFDADLNGKLVAKDNCIRVVEPKTGSIYTPVWEQGTKLSQDQSAIHVVFPTRKPMTLRINREIFAGGGFVEPSWAKKNAKLGPCPGPYWLMGFEITSP